MGFFLQLDKLVEKQRETHRRMLEQLLMVEQAHKQALYKLEDEKRNHGEFMKKSDEFTNLLEQERERSVYESNDGEKLHHLSVCLSTPLPGGISVGRPCRDLVKLDLKLITENLILVSGDGFGVTITL